MSTYEGFIAILGSLTFGLSILTYLHRRSVHRHQRATSRPDIEIRPDIVGNGELGVGRVVIRNKGSVAPVVDHIGWLPNRRAKEGPPLLQDDLPIKGEWTPNSEVKPWYSTTALFHLKDLPAAQDLGVIYAQPSVGKRIRAGRSDMRRFRKELTRWQRQRILRDNT